MTYAASHKGQFRDQCTPKPTTSSQIEQLEKRVAEFERQVQSMAAEKQILQQSFEVLQQRPLGITRQNLDNNRNSVAPDGLNTPYLNIPQQKSIPRHWRAFEFNGEPVYIIPLADQQPKPKK